MSALRASLFVAAAAALVSACDGECTADAIPRGSDAAAIADHLAAACLSQQRTPGLLVAVNDGATTHVAVAGTRTVDGDAIQPGDVFAVGSITKSFASVMLHQLEAEGAVDLDDAVDEHFDGLPNGDATLRQLLQMTSGLPEYVKAPEIADALHRPWTRDELLDWLRAQEPVAAPGATWAYTNTNYMVLGFLIEDLTGTSFAEALRARITQPLGLTSTGVIGFDELPAGAPVGHADDGSSPAIVVDPSIVFAAGGVFTSGEDMLAWAAALAGDDLLPAAQRDAMRAAAPVQELSAPLTGRYASGLLRVDVEGREVLGHAGAHPIGFTSFFAFDPASGKSAFAVVNARTGATRHMVLEALRAMLRG